MAQVTGFQTIAHIAHTTPEIVALGIVVMITVVVVPAIHGIANSQPKFAIRARNNYHPGATNQFTTMTGCGSATNVFRSIINKSK